MIDDRPLAVALLGCTYILDEYKYNNPPLQIKFCGGGLIMNYEFSIMNYNNSISLCCITLSQYTQRRDLYFMSKTSILVGIG